MKKIDPRATDVVCDIMQKVEKCHSRDDKNWDKKLARDAARKIWDDTMLTWNNTPDAARMSKAGYRIDEVKATAKLLELTYRTILLTGRDVHLLTMTRHVLRPEVTPDSFSQTIKEMYLVMNPFSKQRTEEREFAKFIRKVMVSLYGTIKELPCPEHKAIPCENGYVTINKNLKIDILTGVKLWDDDDSLHRLLRMSIDFSEKHSNFKNTAAGKVMSACTLKDGKGLASPKEKMMNILRRCILDDRMAFASYGIYSEFCDIEDLMAMKVLLSSLPVPVPVMNDNSLTSVEDFQLQMLNIHGTSTMFPYAVIIDKTNIGEGKANHLIQFLMTHSCGTTDELPYPNMIPLPRKVFIIDRELTDRPTIWVSRTDTAGRNLARNYSGCDYESGRQLARELLKH